ncbi:MAG: hypothetical protein AAGF11_24335 [Myxococcota bacterium]
MRKSGTLEDARDLARRIKDLLPSVRDSPVKSAMQFTDTRSSILIDIQGNYRGVLSVQDDMIRLLTYEPLALGEARCTGTFGPSKAATGSLFERPSQP